MMLLTRQIERYAREGDAPGGPSGQGGRVTRQELVLAALSAGGRGVWFEPVQVQKLFFLIDREISRDVGGPHFNFRPYDYGPFDSDVYTELERMEGTGLAHIAAGYYRSYSLSEQGHARGAELLKGLPGRARDFITRAARWVNSLSFSQLVSAIYDKYPDMKAASIFRGE